MSWFKKRRSEEINIVNPDENIFKDTSNEEKTIVKEDKPLINPNLSYDEKKNVLIKEYNYLDRSLKNIIHDYYLCKIYSKAALKDSVFEDLMLSMDKQTIKYRKDCYEMYITVNNIKVNNNVDEEKFNEVYKKIMELQSMANSIYHNINDTRSRYYNHLKIATFNVCINKNNQELEKVYNNLIDYLSEYKNLNEASDFIFLHSGDVIIKTIEMLLRCIKDSKHHEHLAIYDYHYFLKSEAVLYLELSEWIDLYNKIKFVIKSIGDIDVSNYLDFNKYFRDFEMRYLILMLNEETKKINKIRK